jgi:rhodanese-related sulfurtransferase
MVTTVSIQELAAAKDRGDPIVDVREHHEYISGHVPGAAHLPMHTIPLHVDSFAKDQPVYLLCESGARSWQVAAFLDRHGIPAVNVTGGTAAWRASGLPLTTGATA